MDIEQQIKEYLLGRLAELREVLKWDGYTSLEIEVTSTGVGPLKPEPRFSFRAYTSHSGGSHDRESMSEAIRILAASKDNKATDLRKQAALLIKKAESLEGGAA